MTEDEVKKLSVEDAMLTMALLPDIITALKTVRDRIPLLPNIGRAELLKAMSLTPLDKDKPETKEFLDSLGPVRTAITKKLIEIVELVETMQAEPAESRPVTASEDRPLPDNVVPFIKPVKPI